jgi:hypothetical protein
VNAAVPQTGVEQEISNLTGIIEEKENIISRYEEEIYELNKQLLISGQEQSTTKKTTTAAANKPAVKKPSAVETTARKTAAKKTAAKVTAKSKKKADPGSGKSTIGTKTRKRKA